MNTVELAVRDGIPYAIDFMNSAPDADRNSVGEENFQWVVTNMADILIDRALNPWPFELTGTWPEQMGHVAAPPGKRLPPDRRRQLENRPVFSSDRTLAEVTMSDRPAFTLGIEEEFQIIDPVTREMRSHLQMMFAEGTVRLKDQIKREMHQSVVEVGTNICANVTEARDQVTLLRRAIIELAARTVCGWPQRERIPSRTGATCRSLPIPDTSRSFTICRWWPAPISSSACTCTWPSKILKRAFRS